MVIIDKMILTGRFTEFVQELMKIRNQEVEEQTRWDFWLHRVFDMSFADYLKKIGGTEETEETIPEEQLVEIVRGTMESFKDFCPS